MPKILEFKNKDNKKVGSMEIKNSVTGTPQLFFYGDIVSSSWDKWEWEDKCPQDVTDFLKNINSTDDIEIYINSGGGSAFAAFAIYNQLKRHQGFKTVYVDGLAASSASIITLAGDKIIIPSNALFMIHKPLCGAYGNVIDLEKIIVLLNKCEENILSVYSENIKEGVNIDDIQQMMQEETWLTGEETAKYFNIEVEDTAEIVACSSDFYSKYNKVPKQIQNIKTNIINKELEKEQLLLELDLI